MSQKTLARVNVNQIHDESMSMGQKIADKVASGMGSWRFIIIQSVIVFVWIGANVWFLSTFLRTGAFDPFPFVLLNLFFSTQASYAAPIIMMSQNRQADKDRITAEADYHTNLAAKVEVEEILHRIEAQDVTMIKQHQELLAIVLRQSDAHDAVLAKLDAHEALLKTLSTSRTRSKTHD